MDIKVFKKSAQFIVKRNVSERIARVLATFEPQEGILHLIYCTRGTPASDDFEDCEIACAELIAEFPEIKKAKTQCLSSEEYLLENDKDEVFSSTVGWELR